MNKKLWLELPETRVLLKDLETRIQDIKDQWLSGAFTQESIDGTAQKNAEAIGWANGLGEAIDFIKAGVEVIDD